MCRQAVTVCLSKSPTRQDRSIGSLALRLQTLADPCARRGKRHPFVAVLLVACSAVVAGAQSFATVFGVRVAPSGAMVRRVILRTCTGRLADLLGGEPDASGTVAVDGKSARGSHHGTTAAAHLLAAMTGSGQTNTQLRVPDKTNEITCSAALLASFDLTGITVIADALHTQHDHARFLVETNKAQYAFTVKRNQEGLYKQLRTLPWQKATAVSRPGSCRPLTLTDLDMDFPHAVQVAKIVRHRTTVTTGKRTHEFVYVITDLTSRQAFPRADREDRQVAVGDREPASRTQGRRSMSSWTTCLHTPPGCEGAAGE